MPTAYFPPNVEVRKANCPSRSTRFFIRADIPGPYVGELRMSPSASRIMSLSFGKSSFTAQRPVVVQVRQSLQNSMR